MNQMETSGAIVGGFTREKQHLFGGVAMEEVLVTDTGKEISLGCAPRIGRELEAYGVRPSEILDAARVEIVSLDGVAFKTPLR